MTVHYFSVLNIFTATNAACNRISSKLQTISDEEKGLRDSFSKESLPWQRLNTSYEDDVKVIYTVKQWP